MLGFLAVLLTVVFRTIAALFAIAFIAATLLVLLIRSADPTLFDARLYKRVLSLNQVYQRVPALAAEILVSDANQDPSPLRAALQDMPPAERVELFELLLPPAETRRLAEGLVDQGTAYLNGEADTVVVSLREVKAHLAGPAGERLLLRTVNTQAACVRALQAERDAPAGCGELGAAIAEAIDALPADARREVLAADDLGASLRRFAPKAVTEAHAQASELLTRLPDEQVLIAPLGTGAPDPREYLYEIRAWSTFAPLVPLALLLGVALFAVRSLRGWLVWWGVPLLLAGVLGVAIGFTSHAMLDWAWVRWVVLAVPPDWPPAALELGLGVVRVVVDDLATGLSFEAGLLAWAGLAAVIIALVLPGEGGRSGRETLR